MTASQKIFITGASSGIGAAMAMEYAKRGATLGLAARRKEKLEQIAQECLNQGAKDVKTYSLDVKDAGVSEQIAKEFMALGEGIDIVVANAGLAISDQLAKGESSRINHLLNTNILGVTNTIIPFIPQMKKQKKGKCVIISSIAAFNPMPYFGGYGASKVAVRMLADSWRKTLLKHNIQFTTICPGYVKSEMTDVNEFHMPFLMATDVAARKMLRAIDVGKKTYILPWQWRVIIRLKLFNLMLKLLG